MGKTFTNQRKWCPKFCFPLCEAKSAHSSFNQLLHIKRGTHQKKSNINSRVGEMSFRENKVTKTVQTNSSPNLTGFGSTMHGVYKVPPPQHAIFTETNEWRRAHRLNNLIITTFRRRLLQRQYITQLQNLKESRPD